MKKKELIDLFSSGEYQRPIINIIDVLLNGSTIMTISNTVDGEGNGNGNDYNPGGGIDL